MHNEADGNTANDAAPTIVRIAYRSFGKPVPDNRPECGCVYYWPFREPPGPGQWVTVPGSRPEIYAIVTGFGNKGDANGTPIKTIASVVPDELVAEEQRKTDADMVAWLWV
ncbi:hypothetical protein EHH44_21570, partial [Mycolicibacter terrae]